MVTDGARRHRIGDDPRPEPATATANHGDNTFYWRTSGVVGLTVLALMAVARVLAWYVFRFGRGRVDDQAAEKGMSQ